MIAMATNHSREYAHTLRVFDMPMQRHLYPANWNAIALEVKTDADWQCQQCGKECRRANESLTDFITRVGAAADKPRRFTLTVAHFPDMNPANVSKGNLLALCAPCHLRLDAVLHAASRRRNKAKLKDQPQT